ncbi:MAG: hypothetical protein HYT89_02080 [Candidatus Omnitrophica bacterium]|nr:hypothetical protein [Candidatus Omnitrophota bacterium]
MKVLGVLAGAALCLAFSGMTTKEAWAATAAEIDARVDRTLERFYGEARDGRKLVQDAKGVLVFPSVYKAGLGIGGSFGEGALRIGGKTVDYYSTVMGSIGLQIGVEKKSILLLFMEKDVLDRLRSSSNWKVGADASVTLVTVGADGSIDTQKTNQPILGFVIGQKGLMYNLTLEGTKFTKLKK